MKKGLSNVYSSIIIVSVSELKIHCRKSYLMVKQYLTLLLIISLFQSCTFLSNREYVQNYAAFKGIHRIAVFLQRWPVYLQKPAQSNLGDDFIKTKIYFWAPWKLTAQINPRAVDIQDIDEDLVGELLVKILQDKGFQADLVELAPLGAESLTVEAAMAQYQAVNPSVDAFLFFYYSPTLFLSHAQATPKDHAKKSYRLQEVMRLLGPANDSTTWVGTRSPQAPLNSISHAFIYMSLTLFKARDWRMLLEVADSQTAGSVHPWIPDCPPGPTEIDYRADAGVIQRLMVSNLRCRLRHIIPNSF